MCNDKKAETAINRIIGDLQDRGIAFDEIQSVTLDSVKVDEGLLVTLMVFLEDDEDHIEYNILVTDETEEYPQ